jgi:glycosyltransferase involved in cell wall biosynthesis
MTRRFSLVLPCYNEAPSLPMLVSRAVACARRRGLSPDEFRLVLVENGSSDGSLDVMKALAAGADGEFLQVVPVSPNRGYGAGLKAGLGACLPGIVAWTHADEQCDPEDAFLGWEIVAGSSSPTLVKGRRHGRAAAERIVSLGFETLASAIFMRRLREINAQPKVFPSGLLDRLESAPDDFAFDLFMLLEAARADYRIREIDVRFPPRRHGESRWAATMRSRFRTMAGLVRYMIRLRLSGGSGQ